MSKIVALCACVFSVAALCFALYKPLSPTSLSAIPLDHKTPTISLAPPPQAINKPETPVPTSEPQHYELDAIPVGVNLWQIILLDSTGKHIEYNPDDLEIMTVGNVTVKPGFNNDWQILGTGEFYVEFRLVFFNVTYILSS